MLAAAGLVVAAPPAWHTEQLAVLELASARQLQSMRAHLQMLRVRGQPGPA